MTESGLLHAQRVDIQPFVGTRFGGGFTVAENIPGAPRPVDLNIESGLAWGGTVGIEFADVWAVEFLWSRQESALSGETPGLPKTDIFNMTVSQFHGNALIHAGDDEDSRLRPYILFGLGATYFDPDLADVDGLTKFSFGLGGGVKSYLTSHAGFRAQFRWTPTYITSTPGVFCSFYCYAVDVADYANQMEVTAGVTLRF
jgi:opacity protein-like surface antigen